MAEQHHYRGRLLEAALLASYTSWQVGGPAKYLYQPADLDDLSLFLGELSASEPLLILGAGTNVLIRDSGFAGTVVVFANALNELKQQEACVFRAEAGVPSARLAKMTIDLGLQGLEFLIGIPGTVGGALSMNAGAYGGSTWNCVVAVETINRYGERFLRYPDEFKIGYRSIQKLKDEWFTAGIFKLEPSNATVLQKKAAEMLVNRKAKHPLHLPNAGSVFRNSAEYVAGKLIEECGLKGCRVGGASISEKHANFIVNDRSATAKDIELLIVNIQDQIMKRYGIQLEREVIIVGD